MPVWMIRCGTSDEPSRRRGRAATGSTMSNRGRDRAACASGWSPSESWSSGVRAPGRPSARIRPASERRLAQGAGTGPRVQAGADGGVSRPCPDSTPEVVAAEGTWLLTRDAGRQLRGVLKSGDPAPSWDEPLPRYAELQIELVDVVEELVALGAPDRRPGEMSAAYPELVERVAGLAHRGRRAAPGTRARARVPHRGARRRCRRR